MGSLVEHLKGMVGKSTFGVKSEERGRGKRVVRECEFKGEGMEGEAEGETREGSACGEKGSDGAVVGEDSVAKHGEEIMEGEEGVRMCGDE